MAAGSPIPRTEPAAALFQKCRTGLVTLVFTDVVDSTALLNHLGDQAGARFLQQRRQLIRDALHTLPDAEEIETAGDSFLLAFAKPSDAVRFALQAQARLRQFSRESGLPVQERIGIHLGEVVIEENETETKAKDLYGIQLATCARVMSLAEGGQILLTRGVFDSARQVLKGEDIPGVGPLSWVSHGPYLLKGIEEAVEVCEVSEADQSARVAPKTSEKAQRQVRPDEEPVLGWRPAVGQIVPDTRWVLQTKLGEGGVGEVWVAKHQKLEERRVFKFCFRGERVRALKREVTLFGILKERVGNHPHIVHLHDVYLEKPPYYLEEEYVEGKDLLQWCADRGGVGQVPLTTRLEIVAQTAEGLQAAHDCGIIHRDVKPGNILLSGRGLEPDKVVVKLSDFGVGQVTSAEVLAGVTRSGFTQTMLPSGSTQTGTLMYLAPELMAGTPATTRSDIYSLGVVLYQLLAGDLSRPVTTDWTQEIEDPLLREDLQHCFAGKPADRFAGAGQLGKSLRGLPERRAELERSKAEKLRLERAAYLRGVIRTASVAAVIVTALAGLTIVAWNQSRRATVAAQAENRQRQRAEQHLYAAHMSWAQLTYERGDYAETKDLLDRHLPKPGTPDLRGWEWRFLRGRLLPDNLQTMSPHHGEVKALGFVDGTRLLTGTLDEHRIALWEIHSGRLLDEMRRRVFDLAIHPSGRIFAVATGREPHTELFAIEPLRLLATLPGIEDQKTLRFSPTGRHLATLGDEHLRIWDLEWDRGWHLRETNLVADLEAGGFWPLAFSWDGELLAYAPTGKLDVAVYSLKQRQVSERLDSKLNGIAGLAFSPDSSLLAVVGWEGNLGLLDLKHKTAELLYRYPQPLRVVVFSRDGNQLVAAGEGGKLHVWDVANRKERASLTGHSSLVSSMAFSPDGTLLATGSKDRTCRIWDVSQATWEDRLVRRVPCEKILANSANGRFLLLVEKGGEVALWDLKEPRRLQLIRAPEIWSAFAKRRWQQRGGECAAVDCSGSRVVVADADKNLVLWNLQQESVSYKLGMGASQVGALAFSWNGAWFGAAATNQPLLVYDSKNGRVQAALKPPSDSPTASAGRLVFTVDDRRLIAARGPDLLLFDIDSEKLLHEQRLAHARDVTDVCVSADGRLIATFAADDRLRLWNSDDLALRHDLPCYAEWGGVTFDGSGKRVLTQARSSRVALWDTISGDQLGTLNPGLRGFLQPLQFCAESDILAVRAWDERILYLCRAPSQAEIDAAEKAQARARSPAPPR